MKKKSRLAEYIEDIYLKKKGIPLTFGQILDKHATIGESCDTVAAKLKELLNIKITLLHSSFGNAVRLQIKQGNTSFRIAAKKPNNPLRKKGSGRKKRVYGTSSTREYTSTDIQDINCEISCSSCASSYSANLKYAVFGKRELLGLGYYVCEECGSVGTCSAIFLSPINKKMEIAKMQESVISGINVKEEVHTVIETLTQQHDKEMEIS